METLGSEDNRAYIYDRRGESQLLELPTASVEYPRLLSEVGRATVTVAPADCVSDLKRIGTWAHTLVIQRGGQRVWEGPIRRKVDSVSGLTIVASDVAGIMERRPVSGSRVGNYGLLDEMAWTINAAFATDNPNVLAHVRRLTPIPLTGGTVARDLQIGGSYHEDDLTDLSGSGGRWTVLGRSIMYWHDAHVIGRLRTLIPEQHLLAGVDVVEDGDALGTEVVARDDNGLIGRVGGFDPYYGHVGLVVGQQGASTVPSLVKRATAARNQSYPAPLSIEVPGDAALSCDSPFPFSQLVPGMLWPVETVTATAKVVRGTFVLQSVKVTQDAGQDEKVTVTLAPLTQAVV